MAEKKAFVFDTNFIIQNQNLDEALDKLKEKFSVYITQVSIDERIVFILQRFASKRLMKKKGSSIKKECRQNTKTISEIISFLLP